MPNHEYSEGEPHDRMTRVANRVLENFEQLEEAEGLRAIVFINGKDRSGIGSHGYEDSTEILVDLFMHLKALFEVNGKELSILPITRVGQG